MSALPFDIHTVFQRAPNVQVKLASHVDVTVRVGQQKVKCGNFALPILSVFAQPRTFNDGIAALRPLVQGAQAWVEMTKTAVELVMGGALLDTAAADQPMERTRAGFDSPYVHVAMLQDRTRTERFIEAIRETVRPEDVVIDIGTGTGVLAAAAALAGAHKVYAIEVGTIGRLAQEVFEANGVSDRVELVRGWSTDVTLAERATVLVSETLGSNPFSERILEIMTDARKRLLTPDARYIPHDIRVWGLPVTVPTAHIQSYTFRPEAIQTWQEWYGIDFGPLERYAGRVPPHAKVSSSEAVSWQTLAEPVLLATLDFRTVTQTTIQDTTTFAIEEAGALNGVLVYFETGLGSKVLTTDPAHADEQNHWACSVYLLGETLDVEPGDLFEATYGYRAIGQPDGVRIRRIGEDAASGA